MSDSSDDMEAYSGMLEEDDKYFDQEQKIVEVIEYCLPHTEKMWAAKIISILLNCDFKESKQAAESYLEEFND
jgi:hypothetical protein